ncbi:MAG: YbaK/EbsC family protein [Rhodoglobus sp.]|nr:YbaK/EbsC family protein [Rhodoglobus sp.]
MTDSRAAAYAARLGELGVVIDVREMDQSTHTAQEAAAAVGCPVEAIVKSLLFVAGARPVLVLASGPNRVDAGLVEQVLGEPVTMADAKTVKLATGYSIGGVPPIGHPQPLHTIIDETLLVLDEVWAAAGSANSVFAMEPNRLVELSGGTVARIA